jgi:hypothetical protein
LARGLTGAKEALSAEPGLTGAKEALSAEPGLRSSKKETLMQQRLFLTRGFVAIVGLSCSR